MPVAAFHALICKRDHRAALGWIGIIVLFPVAGPLTYFMFGINRLRTRARIFTGHHLPALHLGYERATRDAQIEDDPLIAQLPLPSLALVGGRATGISLSGGNHISCLANGEAFYPRLIEAVDNAENYVLLSSYLFSRKGAAGDVIAALGRAAQRKVVVRILIDGLGAWYSFGSAVQPLRAAGADVKLFRAPSLLPLSLDINLRNHRKIAVVDGHTAFFGGINIDQRHMVTAPDNHHITEDIHFEARGPVVSALHQLFAVDWELVTRAPLVEAAFVGKPPVETSINETFIVEAATVETPAAETPLVDEPSLTASAANAICRVIDSGPGDKLNQLAMTLLGVFAAARTDITIMVPYFLPNHEMVAALQAATLRGVRVRVLLPERSNLRFVDWATRNMLWELLLWDVEIYFKPAPFAHTKLITIDGHYVMAGSANLDARSLRLNFELGVEIFNATLAQEVKTHIDTGIATSRRALLSELDQRRFLQRARDAFFWLFSSYL